MPKPFDATVKDMAAEDPLGFLALFDRQTNLPVQSLNVDLSTVTTSADIGFGIGDPLEEILHFDAQTGPSADLQRSVFAYNALFHRHYKVPVHSTVLLLRPRAQHDELTGQIQYAARPDRGKMVFEFEIVRLWKIPVERLLSSSLATTPLAVLGQLPTTLNMKDGLAAVIHKLVERLQAEATPEQMRRLLTSAYILTGLRVRRESAQELFMGVQAMRESDTYQAILDEGRVEGRIDEVRRVLIRIGSRRLGPPDTDVLQRLTAIDNLNWLEELCERVSVAQNWDDLLAT